MTDEEKSDTEPEERPPDDGEGDDELAWLKDRTRANESADYGRLLEQAVAELSGAGGGTGRSGVVIVGDVHLEGDLFGGDKHGGGGGRGLLVSGEVDAGVLAELGRCFVPPPGYRELLRRLRERRVVLLSAPRGWGRTTAALQALAEMGTGPVHTLNPDTDLRRLNGREDLAEGCGHLIEIRAVERLAGLRVPHLEELSGSCAARKAWLVITVDDDCRLDGAALADFGVPGGERSEPGAVLRRHLRLRMADGEGGRAAKDVLSDERVTALLDRCADVTLSMRRLAELAGRIAGLLRAGDDLAVIDSYIEEQSNEDFAQWFEEQSDAAQRAFVIALAGLNGMSYFTVSRAARRLEEMILDAESPEDDARIPVFGTGREQRLEKARAESVPSTDHTPYGPVRTEGVRFRNDGYPRRVLERIWWRYDGVRPIVLAWLRELGADADRTVRIRAAAVAGLLATIDFERLRREVLLPWAGSDDIRVRSSAVAALRLPLADSSELAVLIIRMVRDWAGPRGNRARRWTAARALGVSVGRAIRPEAIRLLRGMAAREDVPLAFAVADSMMELFVDVEDGAQTDVVHALARWTSDTAPAPRRATGMLCFLQLALYVSTEDPASGTPWPSLLWLAAEDEAEMTRLGRMWRRAMGTPGQFATAQSAFALWVTMADGSAAMTDALRRLLPAAIKARYDADRFTESIEQSATDHRATDATRSLLETIAELEIR